MKHTILNVLARTDPALPCTYDAEAAVRTGEGSEIRYLFLRLREGNATYLVTKKSVMDRLVPGTERLPRVACLERYNDPDEMPDSEYTDQFTMLFCLAASMMMAEHSLEDDESDLLGELLPDDDLFDPDEDEEAPDQPAKGDNIVYLRPR